jgi:type IV pilus assembly protein PilE
MSLQARSSQARSRESGFTLLELMVVVAIIAIIAAIAIPSYTQYIRKSHRADALQRMQQIALAQERYRAEHPGYTEDWTLLGSDPDATSPNGIGAWFEWEVDGPPTLPANEFVVTVTAQGDQAKDKAGGTACTTLTLAQDGTRSPAACWER